MELVHSVLRHGQRALVGKVSMNVENSAGYYNDTQTEVEEVNRFVEQVLLLKVKDNSLEKSFQAGTWKSIFIVSFCEVLSSRVTSWSP